MKLQTRKAKASTVLLATAIALSGCAVVIERPANNSAVAAGSAPARVAMKYLFSQPTTFNAYVAPLQTEGSIKTPGIWREVTPDFTLSPGSGVVTASGALALTPGEYRLRAVACWYINTNPSPTIPWNCQQAEVDVNAVPASIALAPASLSLEAGNTATVAVTAIPPPGSDLQIALSSPLTSPVMLTIPADIATAVASPPFTAQKSGAASLGATAGTTYGTASAPVTVRPKLSSISPTSGVVGTTVTATGAGFVAPMKILFGGVQATATVSSSTQARASVPAGLTSGSTVQVTVQSNGQTSIAHFPFAVQATPVTGTLLFRSHASGVETIRFRPASGATPASFTIVAAASVAATPSPGMAVVGLARSGNTLLRASASALETFTIGGTIAAPTLTPAGASPATGSNSASLSGAGVDAAFLNGQLLRGTDRGVEIYQPGSAPLSKLGSQLNRPAAGAVGISLLSHPPGSTILRSTSSSLELWDMSNPAVPVVLHNNIGVFTAPLGSGLAWLSPGQRLVRGFSSGIQILDVSGGQTTVSGANNTGGAGSMQAIVALPNGRVARSTGMNLEIYDLGFGPDPVPCATSNAGFSSSAGVALAVDGTMLFRATATGIEAWDLSALTCTSTPLSGTLPPPVQLGTGLAPAPTGLGLAGPN